MRRSEAYRQTLCHLRAIVVCRRVSLFDRVDLTRRDRRAISWDTGLQPARSRYGASDCIHSMTRPFTKSCPSASDIGFSGTDEGLACRPCWAECLNNDRRFFVAQPSSRIFFSVTERRMISNTSYRSRQPSDFDRAMIFNASARSVWDRARA